MGAYWRMRLPREQPWPGKIFRRESANIQPSDARIATLCAGISVGRIYPAAAKNPRHELQGNTCQCRSQAQPRRGKATSQRAVLNFQHAHTHPRAHTTAHSPAYTTVYTPAYTIMYTPAYAVRPLRVADSLLNILMHCGHSQPRRVS